MWTPEAIQDREDIYDYIEADNPAAALDLDELLEEKTALLVDHPNPGRLTYPLRHCTPARHPLVRCHAIARHCSHRHGHILRTDASPPTPDNDSRICWFP
ncbi:type II toxin-antitoxin system RelE/ParE family toxin [Burkholderia sp. Ac-20353]|nr:type II toxin-antitoxin system RelE/ParE family toxin [Burkholderia sp. Ac-20353]